MSETLLVAAVRGLIVKQSLGKGLQIQDDLFLSNELDQLNKLIGRDLKLAMGGLEWLHLQKSCFIYYLKRDLAFELEQARSALEVFLQNGRVFFQALWLVRDNAVNVELGFLETENAEGQKIGSSNYIVSLFARHDGSLDEEAFDLDDLKRARSFYQSHLLPLVFESTSVEDLTHPPPAYSLAFCKNASRLSRFNTFLSGVRSERDLPVRIAQAMTCFEVLFSSDASELSHKLSERVAWFVGEGSKGRREIYSLLKRAYGVRSKVVHGDTLSPALLAELEVISREIDNLLRQVFLRIIDSKETIEFFTSGNQQLEEYFLNLVLGGYE